QLSELNKIGLVLGELEYISAMTDITGFGLLGHVIEMAEGCGKNIELFYNNIPAMPGAKQYLAERIVPDATYRNWNSFSKKVGFEKGVNVMEAFNLLSDPQTNGGILFSCSPEKVDEVKDILSKNGIAFTDAVGVVVGDGNKVVMVKNNS
ncbi:MAG: AIR synthase-related protein, partial [Ferruginibacter sp.]